MVYILGKYVATPMIMDIETSICERLPAHYGLVVPRLIRVEYQKALGGRMLILL
jgi:hypothetical protein